ncbi:MAG: hypothetical protein ACLGGV_07845 [Bacteroidia bacterium]
MLHWHIIKLTLTSGKHFISMKMNFKALLPHLLAVAIFLAISVAYFYPALQEYTLKMGDIESHKGMSKEIADHRLEHEEEPLWTNSMFGGMPATQISVIHYSSFFKYTFNILTFGLPYPINILLMYMIGFYILLMCLRVNPWLAISGSIAFAFSSYFIVILEAGHISKSYAIAFMPCVLGSILLAYRGKILLGIVLTAFFLALEIVQNHLQITYYLMFVILFVIVAELIRFIKENRLGDFIKISSYLLAAVMLSVAANLPNLWGTYEYGKETIRGKNELALAQGENKKEGLDLGYMTNWSYGKEETATLVIPNAKGGATGSMITSQEDLYAIEDLVLQQEVLQIYQNGGYVNNYWGDQPGTSGPVYVGAIVFLLAIVCVVMIGDGVSWALLLVTILSILLSWGKNFMGFTEFFAEHIPLYNKFRAVTMILVIAELCLPLLMIFFVQKLISEKEKMAQQGKKLFITLGSVISLVFLFWLMPKAFFSFTSSAEAGVISEASPIIDYRVGVFKADALRSLFFMLLAVVLVVGFIKNWFKQNALIAGLGLLILIDLVGVDLRYLNNKTDESGEYAKWQPTEKLLMPFRATEGDYAIYQLETEKNPELAQKINLKVKEAQQEKLSEGNGQLTPEEQEFIIFGELNKHTNYRVFAGGDSFNESRTSYFHKSVGGYHGAKLRRYQDLIEHHLSKNNEGVLNMLNTKYFLVPYKNDPVLGTIYQLNGSENPLAMGNAWFAKNIEWAKDTREEMMLLGDVYSVKTLTEKQVLSLNGNTISEAEVGSLDSLKLYTPDGFMDLDLTRLNLSPNQTVVLGSDSSANINIPYLDGKHLEVTLEKRFNPRNTTIINEQYRTDLSNDKLTNDSSATISLTEYRPNYLSYESSSSTKQLAVFSEIYYGLGWQAYIDGTPVNHIRVNYVLRGLLVPEGEHNIEFKYSLKSYDVGNKIALASSVLIILLLLGVFYKELRIKN